MGTTVLININQIEIPTFLARNFYDDEKLEQLKESLDKHGQLHQIVVRRLNANKYQLIAGWRRIEALKKLKKKIVEAKVIKCSEEEADILRIHENIHREEIDEVSLGEYFRELILKYKYSQAKLAEKLNLSQPTVSRLLKLASIKDEFKDLVRLRKISYLQALEIAELSEDSQHRLIEIAKERNITHYDIQAEKTISQNTKISELQKTYDEGFSIERGATTGEEIYVTKSYAKCDACSQEYEWKDTINVTLCLECHKVTSEFWFNFFREEEQEQEGRVVEDEADNN